VVTGEEEELQLRLRQDYNAPGLIEVQSVVVKCGPKAWKTAAVLTFGDKSTGVVRNRTLRVQTWKRGVAGFGFEYKPDFRWSCDDDEIKRLAALLTTELPAPGTYTLVDEASAAAAIARLTAGDADAAAAAVVELLSLPSVRDALAASGAAVAGAALVTAQRQRAALDRLKAAVLDPGTTEHDLQKVLTGEWWLFGGRFLGEHQRRQFTSLDQLDIPLLRADGSLHIVELKRAFIPKLIVRHRNHAVPGEDVHLAVGQAMNYLRALDEQAAQIRQDVGVDVRRATATVVVGHPEHSSYGDDEEVAQTLRTYNSHLARIEVISYAELLAGAEAALAVGESDVVQELRSISSEEPPAFDVVTPDPAGEPWPEVSDWNSPGDPWVTGTVSWGDEPPF
jgi:hypothetical protein